MNNISETHENSRINNNKKKGDDEEEEAEQEAMLPGFRFHPTDEELVGFYLKRKVAKKTINLELIKQVDIYKYDPWDLPKVSTVGEKEWYFFCLRGRKYRNSIRPNRVTGSGFWKATGIDKPIYSVKQPHDCIGLKKSLVYYRGSAGKGTKTDWMMHEFRLPPSTRNHNNYNNVVLLLNAKDIAQEAEVWTLCRIFKRVPTYKKYVPADWKATPTTTIKQQNTTTDSSSKTCSFESENSHEMHLSFGDSTFVQQDSHEMKPVIVDQVDERNGQYLFMGQFNSLSHQAPFTSGYPGIWNPNADDFFTNGNWDELKSVVELAIDPSQRCYDYR